MLVRSNTRYVPTAVNMIVIQGKDDDFYYLHRSLYDQCVILYDAYADKLPFLFKLLGFDEGHPAVCDRFVEAAPEPLSILGPFLVLVKGCEELDNIDDMCGAISSMSMTVDFRRLFKVQPAIRASVKFSLSVREEYRVQWDRFFLETPTLDQMSFTQAPAPASASTEVSDDDIYDTDYGLGDVLSKWATNNEEEEKEEDEEEEAVEEPPKAKSGFAMLRGLK